MNVKLPQSRDALEHVAEAALRAMSRSKLNEAASYCDDRASVEFMKDQPREISDSWRFAADAFRNERRRRY